MLIQAEISLYPMREADVAPVIFGFLKRLERPGLEIQIGPTSSVLRGESELVFQALREAFEGSAAEGKRVLVVKFLN